MGRSVRNIATKLYNRQSAGHLFEKKDQAAALRDNSSNHFEESHVDGDSGNLTYVNKMRRLNEARR